MSNANTSLIATACSSELPASSPRRVPVLFLSACGFVAISVANTIVIRWLDSSISARHSLSTMVTWMRSDATIALAVFVSVAYVAIMARGVKWCLKQIGASLRLCATLYVASRIVLAITAYVAIMAAKLLTRLAKRVYAHLFDLDDHQIHNQTQFLKQARTRTEWTQLKTRLDELSSNDRRKSAEDTKPPCDIEQIKRDSESLSTALAERNVSAIKFLLTTFVARNKSGIDAAELHLGSDSHAKQTVETYQALVAQGLEFLVGLDTDVFGREDKSQFFQKLKRAFGNTGLCLSGGGSIAMYHMGVVRALIKANLLPNVISGSSGGSIVAGLIATRTNQELLDEVFVNDIAVRYIPDGIQWFPPVVQQVRNLITTGSLVSCSDFERTTQHYYGEPMDAPDKTMHYTFQDAFLKTGRHVCITVSASDVTGHKGPKKLLLNHINTPHVLLWSAVAVSCSLPGIMKGKKLMARDHEGNVVPYDAMGKEWVDGSIQHDLPMETMASCFNVTNFIVSQVNPHVVPFVGDDVDEPTFRKSGFHSFEKLVSADLSHAFELLSLLGFGKFSSQEISGDVTLVPDLVFLESIGAKAIVNPSREDMDRYLLGGKRCVWPKLAYISHLCAIEKCLDRCLAKMESTPNSPATKQYENWLLPASSRE